MRRALLSFATAIGLAAATRDAHAEPTQTDAVIAQSLFDEGRNLLAAGKIKEACTKFAESQRLDPGGGTLLNLALCHEREGRLATASAELEAATAQAIKDGRKDRETIARDHFSALQPRLPKVLVEVQGATPDESVALDGNALPRAAWGTPTAVDPGEHHVEASAPGRKPTTRRFRADEKTTVRVTLPALEIDKTAPPAAPPSVSSPAPPPAALPRASWPTVHVESDDPDAQLEEQRRVGPGMVVVAQGYVMVDDGTRWFHSCGTPCDKKLDPQFVYRVNGKGITPSKPFTIPADQPRVELETKTGSYAKAVGAVVLGTFGISALVAGASFLVVGYVVPASDGEPWKTAGFVTLGSGAVLTAAAVLLGLGASTDVHTRSAR